MLVSATIQNITLFLILDDEGEVSGPNGSRTLGEIGLKGTKICFVQVFFTQITISIFFFFSKRNNRELTKTSFFMDQQFRSISSILSLAPQLGGQSSRFLILFFFVVSLVVSSFIYDVNKLGGPTRKRRSHF